MEIRFKDGKPLTVGNGLIAGSQTCCCENPPPPNCTCPDFCSYFIEVVSPSDLAVKSPANSCGGLDTTIPNEKVVDGWPFSDDLGSGYELFEETGWDNFSSGSAVNVISRGFGGGVRHNGNWRREYTTPNPFNPSQPFTGYTYAKFDIFASVSVACVFDEKSGADVGNPSIPTINVFLNVSFTEILTSDEKGGRGIGQQFKTYWLSYNVYLPLPVDCIYNESRSCFKPPYWNPRDGFHYIRVPLDVVVQKDKVTIGDVEHPVVVAPFEYGNQELSRAPLVDEVLNDFSATFRITSRPSCKTVGCNCAAPLGGMRVDLENLKSATTSSTSSYQVSSSLVDFVWMYDRSDQTVSWQGPFGFYEYDQNDPDGPQDGNGKFTRRLWRQRAELYCDIIDGVSQWFVLFTSFRDIYDEAGFSTHRSYDQWVGKIDCYEACEDLDNFIEANESVPMGEPYDIEYLGRTTEAGYLECEPPPRLTIRFTQIATC